MNESTEFEACIDACNVCVAECNQCVVAIADVPNMQDCLKACYDSVEECLACLEDLVAGSSARCLSCADACDRCAAECAKHDTNPDCQEALAACQKCSKECRETAGVAVFARTPNP